MKKLLLILTLVSMQSFAAQLYVDQSATGKNDGSSWADAFTNIQAAVDSAIEDDTILIAQGTYKEGAEVTTNHSATIKGGYPTGGGTQDIANNATIIDGNNSHRVLNATHGSGTLYLEGLTIQNGNSDEDSGGGINTVSDLNLTYVSVINNFSSSNGGGIYTLEGNITLTNSKVSHNNISSSDSGFGGGIYTLNGNLTLINSQVSHNIISSSDSSFGGGIFLSRGNLTLTNSQVSNNTIVSSSSVTSSGGGIDISNPLNIQNTIVFENSILWGNAKSTNGGSSFVASEYDFLHAINLNINHTVIKDQNPVGANNIDATVVNFAADNFVDAVNGNFALTLGSALLNTGNDTYNTTTEDLVGNPRKVGVIDIGAYEANFLGKNYDTAATAYYFNPNSTALNKDGLSWATAFSGLNDYFYINDTSNITNLYLATGAYNTSGTLQFNTQIQLNGGYNPITDMPELTKKSTIDVQQNGRVIHSAQNITLNQIQLTNGFLSLIDADAVGGGLFSSGNVVFSNSQVSNCTTSSTSFSSSVFSLGGGIYASNGSITLTDSQVINNTAFSSSSNATGLGGGIYTNNGSIIVTKSQVSHNSVSSRECAGGGIHTFNGNISLTDSKISHNTSNSNAGWSYGGGVYTFKGTVSLTNSKIFQNSISSPVESLGGGIYTNREKAISLVNSQVSENTATSPTKALGGGVYIHLNTAEIILKNSVVAKNKITAPAAEGGGIRGMTTLENSILWDNTKSTDGGAIFTSSEHEINSLIANYSLIKNQNPTGTNNIDATQMGFDPLFADESNDDFRLLAGSPLIDAGDFNLLPLDDFDVDGDGDLLELIPLDLAGYARDVGLNVDIGPYEFGDLIFKDGFE